MTEELQFKKTGADMWETGDASFTIHRIVLPAACSGGSGSAGAWYFYEDLQGRTGDNHRTLKAAKAQAQIEAQ